MLLFYAKEVQHHLLDLLRILYILNLPQVLIYILQLYSWAIQVDEVFHLPQKIFHHLLRVLRVTFEKYPVGDGHAHEGKFALVVFNDGYDLLNLRNYFQMKFSLQTILFTDK